MKVSAWVNFVIVVLLATVGSRPSHAQGNSGSVTGSVTDQSGAAVPNCHLTLENLATGLKLSTTSSSAGIYLIPNVPNGEYRFIATAPAFKTFQQEPVIVFTATATSVDVSLTLGQVTETVAVQEASTRLETVSSGIGTVLSERPYKQLPLDITNMDLGASGIRQPQQFALMAPGVTGSPYAFHMNGSQATSQSIQIDGHSWLLLNNPAILNSHPPPFEAIAEFKVNTSQYAAENPVGTGGTQFTLKSGTDQFHGSVFHVLRNDDFNARSFFAKAVSPLKHNESAITVGGPVLLPHYNGKHRTHFQGTFTRFSRRGVDNAASLVTVPTQAFKNGDFSGWVDAKGAQLPIFDPASTRPDGAGGFVRDPYPRNIMPASQISTVGRNGAALMPNPTLPGPTNNLIIVESDTQNWLMYTIKVDQAWAPNEISRVTYWENMVDRKTDNGYAGPLGASYLTTWKVRNIMVSHTSILSPEIVNEARWSVLPWIPFQVNKGFYDQAGTSLLGIPNLPSQSGVTPILSISNLSPNLGNANVAPFDSTRKNYAFGDSLSWVRGRHAWKFGASGILSFDDTKTLLNLLGSFTFNNRSTSQPNSPNAGIWGNGFASFLTGDVYSFSRVIADKPTRDRVRRFEAFAQDDFKVSRKLALNLGVNYHIPFASVDGEDRLSGFDPTVPNPGAGGRLGALVFAGSGPGRTGRRSLSDTYYRAFAPRFGFAYALNKSTVLRGGYGIYYGMAPNSTIVDGAPRDGFTYTQSLTTLDLGITPAFNINNGPPVVNVTLPTLDPSLKNGSSAVYVTPDSQRPPLSQNFSFGIQRELPGRMFLDLAYVGNRSSRLPSELENINQLNPSLLSLGSLLNQNITSATARSANIPIPYAGFNGTVSQALRPYPQYTSLSDLYQTTGYSSYQSLQAKFEKRLSSGLMFMTAYTLSKLIDTGADTRAANDALPIDTFNRNLEKALSVDDQTHTVVTSWIYELPFGVGKPFLSHNRAVANLLGNWRLSASLRYTSGSPIRVASSQALPLFGGANRPIEVAGAPLRTQTGNFNPRTDRWLNPAAFIDPAPFAFGTLGRTLPNLRGPWFANENVGLAKEVRLHERHVIELRATLLNALNRAVFNNPSATVGSANFGMFASQKNLPREVELQGRYTF